MLEIKKSIDNLKSPEMRETYKDIGIHLYLMGRWTLAAVIHPIATFRAAMLIGDQETIKRNAEAALRLPKLHLPRGRQRLS